MYITHTLTSFHLCDMWTGDDIIYEIQRGGLAANTEWLSRGKQFCRNARGMGGQHATEVLGVARTLI